MAGKILTFIGLVLLLCGAAAAATAAPCSSCHAVTVKGAHAPLACRECHADDGTGRAAAARSLVDCERCHAGTAGVLHGPMAHRAGERAFAAAFARYDGNFFATNCTGCHVSSCRDCHGGGHVLAKPAAEDCHSCHRGYYVGADYLGRAPREDHQRYQRGAAIDGEKYLKMSADVHAEAGMDCGACHGMASLSVGARSAKDCRDCHRPDPAVIEHRIAAHLEKLECYACHSAWTAQEYGTFFLRAPDSSQRELFRVRALAGGEYLRSAYLRRQDAPPLGWNAAGRLSPIRPQYIAYYSDLRPGSREENRLVAAQWRALFPHTVRRATPACDSCHGGDSRRFLLERAEQRIYLPEKDGLALPSFWDSRGQTLVNGRFVSAEEFTSFGRRTPDYVRHYVDKWQTFVKRVDASSKP